MWRLDNSVGTFFACSNTAPPPRRYVRDLRPELRYAASPGEGSPEASDGRGSTQDSRSASKQPLSTYPSKDSSRGGALVRQYAATTSFERVWWDKGGDTKKHATIWRPQPPAGYCILGDTACEGWVTTISTRYVFGFQNCTSGSGIRLSSSEFRDQTKE